MESLVCTEKAVVMWLLLVNIFSVLFSQDLVSWHSIAHTDNMTMWTRRQKAAIHQVITMVATFGNVLFPGHYHLLTTGTGDRSL